MQVELTGRTAVITGVRHVVAEALADALAANGAAVGWVAGTHAPDILILSNDLAPTQDGAALPLVEEAGTTAEAMAARGGGRIVHLISAMGVIPMRRHAAFSAEAARIVASVRALAMNVGPHVLVNAVAAGTVGTIAGDPAMLSHVPLGREGTIADIVHATLFLIDPANSYTTGQTLVVDGGWTAGYGRNF